MDADSGIEELQAMKRELRRLKFQVSGPTLRACAALERLVEKLIKRFEKASRGAGGPKS